MSDADAGGGGAVRPLLLAAAGPGTRSVEEEEDADNDADEEGGTAPVVGARALLPPWYLLGRPDGGATGGAPVRILLPVAVEVRAVLGGAMQGLRSEARAMLDDEGAVEEGPLVDGRMGASCSGGLLGEYSCRDGENGADLWVCGGFREGRGALDGLRGLLLVVVVVEGEVVEFVLERGCP